MTAFRFTSIENYHRDLSDGAATCAEAVEYFLSNITANERLNAFIEVYADEARVKATELDAARKAGRQMKKLHGVVVAVKDVICYKDHITSAASNMLRGFRSLYTASALQFLLDEDAIVIGSCNCDEFAMGSGNEHSAYGPALNGLDESRVPGGSSGGSAVAVQMKMCMLSLGSDTGGSVRQPADFCGVVGMKPSYGAVSRYGLIAYASSFDQIGVFGNSVADVKTVFEVMSAHDPRDGTMRLAAAAEPAAINNANNWRFGLLDTSGSASDIDPEVREKFGSLKTMLTEKGHSATLFNLSLLDYIVPAYYVLTTAEASSNLGRYDGVRFGHRSKASAATVGEFYTNNRTEGFGKEVRRRIMLGNFVLSAGYYDAYYGKAQQIRRLLVEEIDKLFEKYDALIMPVSPTVAPQVGSSEQDPLQVYLADIFTVYANLTGVPAIAVPLFSHSNNMPFGVQILCKRDAELTLLNAAETLASYAEQNHA